MNKLIVYAAVACALLLAPAARAAECKPGMVFSEGVPVLEQAGAKIAKVDAATQARAVHDFNEANGTDQEVTAVYIVSKGPLAKIVLVNGDCVVFVSPAAPVQMILDLLGVSST